MPPKSAASPATALPALPLPADALKPGRWSGLSEAAQALAIAATAARTQALLLVLAPDTQTALRLD
ncbi:MAG TPA: hypothetical protein PLP08_16795, partial [Plasticicumulans sp.]|nr:hypothetical protein [Plasticicumulans sp.]